MQNPGDVVIEDAGEGVDAVRASVSYALSDNVENLTLTGAADLNATGNAGDNTLAGNSGDNRLDGSTGADAMAGGRGNDTYIVDNAGDGVTERPNEGVDTVLAAVSYALAANVENLSLTGSDAIAGTGNELDNVVTGNGGSNVLDGGTGDDTLSGGAGDDTMKGGAGDDTYSVESAGDAVIENPDEGVDAVSASLSYVLPANVEDLTLIGSDDIDATGNELNNNLRGNAGNNTLDGGAGADTMRAGAGDDAYVVDDSGDTVVENPNEGVDGIFASVSYVLPENVDNLTLTGAADINATGNVMNNVITGNSGANILDGGAGADTLSGGAGDDAYVVDHAADAIVENPNAGNDTVLAAVSYALADYVENLTLTGNADINGTGNALDNVLTGNAGNNVLAGGAGNDTYVVANVADTVTENPNEGIDAILASVSYVLPADVENLTLTGAADINGAGNGLDNVIAGNVGNNVLAGNGGNDAFVGGRGNDVLFGDSGDDTYIYNLDDGLDRITDTGGANAVQFGPGLSLANVAIRLTTRSGEPYPVRADANDRHDRDDGDHGDHGDHAGTRTLTARLRVLNGDGDEQPDQGMEFAVTVDRRGNIVSPIQTFRMEDGGILAFDEVLIKTRTTDARRVSGPVITGRDDDVIDAGRNNTGVWAGTGNDIVYADKVGTRAYGEGGNDYLAGDRGSDTLDGGWGVDIVDGEDGNDILNDPAGNSALLGDDGNDRISAGAGNSFIAGGEDNDIIVAGAGGNVVAFNKGDGLDTVEAAGGATNTLSLGGGIQYSNLKFAQVGNDLILEIGRRDAVTLKGWYADAANQSFVTLQVIGRRDSDDDHRSRDSLRDQRIETFDFGRLVAEFDQARAADPLLTRWNLMNGLLDAHVSGSDTAALGGELAYQYGMRGDLSRLDLAALQAVLAAPQFGKEAQTVQSLR